MKKRAAVTTFVEDGFAGCRLKAAPIEGGDVDQLMNGPSVPLEPDKQNIIKKKDRAWYK
jgi:hypothetical protein